MWRGVGRYHEETNMVSLIILREEERKKKKKRKKKRKKEKGTSRASPCSKKSKVLTLHLAIYYVVFTCSLVAIYM